MREIFENFEWRYFGHEGFSSYLKRKQFKRLLPEIVTELEEIVATAKKCSDSKAVPILRPKSYLSRMIYILVRYAEIMGYEDTLRTFLTQRVEARGGKVNMNMRRIGSNDLYHLAYRAIPIEGLSVKGGELTRLSRGLRFAADDDVPSKYLIGFLYQTSGGRPAAQTPHQIAEEDEDWDDIYDPQADFDEDGNYIGGADEAD